MSVGTSYSMALEGMEGRLVTVECDVSRGLPGISVVGLGDAAVLQAKERIRAALGNSGINWPGSRTVMSLSPASLPKAGAGYDLAMVLAMLAAKGCTTGTKQRLGSAVIVGELGLEGDVRPVDGVLAIVLSAMRQGFDTIVIPQGNAEEAARVSQAMSATTEVVCVEHLKDAIEWMHGAQLSAAAMVAPLQDTQMKHSRVDLADVVGQPEAKRAVEIAAAGGHALMFTGPPGSGKSMLAGCIPGILPPMTTMEQVEAAAVHSVAGSKGNPGAIWAGQRPFVAPHHTVTHAALIGGGNTPRPGAVSLAHHGVLFIDEVAEAKASVLDGLRVPMETRSVELVRQRHIVRYPAHFQLILAANPCPCGAEFAAECTCPGAVRARYQAKLSGPLRDRIDIFARTRTTTSATLTAETPETTCAVAERVAEARQRALARWGQVNAAVPGKLLRAQHPATDEAMLVLQDMLRTKTLTQRGVDRALRVAWTLADWSGCPKPGLEQVCDAVDMYRDGAEVHA
ncbi:YifB family Mg chelatase-like AAA ATPase [Corynebacterium auriscanis]|uniref:Magnesium chelatase n=1 Tax=Corynebacterium auriscanis TaxID=99807 RepID=A0A0A2DRA2_9CORY|nr:YifB family Mg chelatase-like AAA ATPase [Corynebacterium auriscanis]KGM19371.1 magnesium chelatase [Corynebacterium auriscanis]WJY72916.1 Competence protein ComM [Corynebacterium auriscanis]